MTDKPLTSTQNREHLESISSPESRALGGKHMHHNAGHHRKLVPGCKLCNTQEPHEVHDLRPPGEIKCTT